MVEAVVLVVVFDLLGESDRKTKNSTVALEIPIYSKSHLCSGQL